MWALISRWIIQRILIKVLNILAEWLPAVVDEWNRKKQREIEQEKAKQELEVELKKDLTPEEKAKAYAKYQNSGR